jgi:DNA-binding XRE family transcriptional regulator
VSAGTNINLLAERKRLAKSQAEMAALVGVTRRVWAAAENGSEPRGESALKIAKHFGCQTTDIWPVPDRQAV